MVWSILGLFIVVDVNSHHFAWVFSLWRHEVEIRSVCSLRTGACIAFAVAAAIATIPHRLAITAILGVVAGWLHGRLLLDNCSRQGIRSVSVGWSRHSRMVVVMMSILVAMVAVVVVPRSAVRIGTILFVAPRSCTSGLIVLSRLVGGRVWHLQCLLTTGTATPITITVTPLRFRGLLLCFAEGIKSIVCVGWVVFPCWIWYELILEGKPKWQLMNFFCFNQSALVSLKYMNFVQIILSEASIETWITNFWKNGKIKQKRSWNGGVSIAASGLCLKMPNEVFINTRRDGNVEVQCFLW